MFEKKIVHFDLLNNAIDSIITSIENFIDAEENKKDNKCKHAILFLIHALELFFKERIRQEHYLLIYENIDKPKNTINILKALERLKSICKIKFSENEEKTIEKCYTLRNELQHFECKLDLRETKIILAKIYGLLILFCKNHLSLDLRKKLDEDQINVLLSWSEFFDSYSTLVYSELESDVRYYECPFCSEETFSSIEYKCLICGHESSLISCEQCGEDYVESEIEDKIENGIFVCDNCIENNKELGKSQKSD